MIEVFDRSKSRPIPCGLVSTLKSLDVGESIIVSGTKRSAIHPAAKRAGIRVTLRTLENGTVCAWRIPTNKDQTAAAGPAPAEAIDPAPRNIFNDDLDIFGRSIAKAAGPGSADAPQSAPQPTAVGPDPAVVSSSASGHYLEPTAYGSSIFVADLDEHGQIVVPGYPSKKDIFG